MAPAHWQPGQDACRDCQINERGEPALHSTKPPRGAGNQIFLQDPDPDRDNGNSVRTDGIRIMIYQKIFVTETQRTQRFSGFVISSKSSDDTTIKQQLCVLCASAVKIIFPYELDS